MPDENGCFAYGEKETEYLKKKDKKLAEVIDRVGHVYRKTCLLYTSPSPRD